MTSTIGATLMAKLSASILCIGVHNVCQSCNCTLSSLIFTLVDVVISIARLPQSYVSFIKLDIKTLTVSKTHSGISAEDQIGSKTVPYLVNLRGNQRKPSQLSIRTYNWNDIENSWHSHVFSHSYLAVSVNKICAATGLRVGVHAIVGRIPFTLKQQSPVHFQRPAMFWISIELISLEADVFRSGIYSRIRLCLREDSSCVIWSRNTIQTHTHSNNHRHANIRPDQMYP